MRFVLLGGLAFTVLTLATLVVVGLLSKEDEPHDPHPARCDCIKCGRVMVDRYLKKYEATVKREAKLRQTGQ